MNIQVVPMEAAHLDRLAELEALCFSQPWSREALGEEIDDPNACFLTALWGGEVAGYVGAHFACGEFYIDNVAVHPDRRRRGIAKALLRALVDLARGHDGSFLTLEVRPSNEAAMGLYRALGFYEVGRRRGFYERPREDAVLLRLDIKNDREGEVPC